MKKIPYPAKILRVDATGIERTGSAAVRDLCRVNAKPIPPVINGHHRTSSIGEILTTSCPRISTVIAGPDVVAVWPRPSSPTADYSARRNTVASSTLIARPCSYARWYRSCPRAAMAASIPGWSWRM